jgi:hypothetical protein
MNEVSIQMTSFKLKGCMPGKKMAVQDYIHSVLTCEINTVCHLS